MIQDDDHLGHFSQVLQPCLEAITLLLQALPLKLIQNFFQLPIPTMHVPGSATLIKAQISP